MPIERGRLHQTLAAHSFSAESVTALMASKQHADTGVRGSDERRMAPPIGSRLGL
jgi:hypothetical protein